jgi:hypothetical protein
VFQKDIEPAAAEASDSETHPENLIRVEFCDGFKIHHYPDCVYPNLRWQAGTVVSEHRAYHDAAMMGSGRFDETVFLFRLLGYGACRDEAILMARGRTK